MRFSSRLSRSNHEKKESGVQATCVNAPFHAFTFAARVGTVTYGVTVRYTETTTFGAET